MHPSLPQASNKQRFLGICATLAAVLVVALLVGSMVLLVRVRGTKTASPPLSTPSLSVPTPALSPTVASAWELYINHVPRTSFGYTVRYQSAWQVQPENLFVTFSDPKTLSSFSVSPNADPDFGYARSLSELTIAQELATSSLQLFNATAKNTKGVKLAQTVTLHGVTWEQIGEIADVNMDGQVVNVETVIMANHNDQQSLGYVLQLTAPTRLFNASNSTSFQYMVQSFAYTTR